MGRLVLLLIVGLWITSCKTDTQTSPAKPETSEKTAAKKSLPKQNKVPTTKPETPKEVEPKKVPTAMLQQRVDINKIDYALLQSRLLLKINEERRRLGLREFKNHNKLSDASAIHNEYMVTKDILDHTQVGTSTPDMVSRVKKVGGRFRTMGENIQYEGFTIRTTNGVESIIAPTYEELANNLWLNWKNSPPHYKNIINPEFTMLGTALSWSDQKTAIFATQIYAG